MTNKSKIIIFLISIINVIFIFFGYLIGNLFFLQIIQIALLFLVFKWNKLKIYKDTKIWLIYLAFILLNSFISQDIYQSLRFSTMLILVLINKILLENITGWEKKTIQIMYYASLVHVLATIIQFINPEFMSKIIKLILSPKDYITNQELLLTGGHAGITAQTGVNAFYISIFIILSFIKINYENNKIVKSVLLFIAFLALFLTAKRSFLIFSIILFGIYYLFKEDKNKMNKVIKLFGIAIICFIGFEIIKRIGVADLIIDKTQNLEEHSDLTNGRNILWIKTIEMFLRYPIFGCGVDTIALFVGEYTHNMYIQLLAETGIIGIILFIVAVIYSLKASIKIKKKNPGYIFSDVSIYIQALFLFYGFTGNPIYGHIFLMTYFLSIALNKREGEEKSNEKSDENRNHYIPYNI